MLSSKPLMVCISFFYSINSNFLIASFTLYIEEEDVVDDDFDAPEEAPKDEVRMLITQRAFYFSHLFNSINTRLKQRKRQKLMRGRYQR